MEEKEMMDKITYNSLQDLYNRIKLSDERYYKYRCFLVGDTYICTRRSKGKNYFRCVYDEKNTYIKEFWCDEQFVYVFSFEDIIKYINGSWDKEEELKSLTEELGKLYFEMRSRESDLFDYRNVDVNYRDRRLEEKLDFISSLDDEYSKIVEKYKTLLYEKRILQSLKNYLIINAERMLKKLKRS